MKKEYLFTEQDLEIYKNKVKIKIEPEDELALTNKELTTEEDYEEYEGDFGEIVALKKKHGPVVKLRDGNLILKNVKLQGKKNQSGIDLLNGRVFQTGDKFI